MKILLLADVKGQGKKGQIVDVSEGYYKNFLAPKKLGTVATSDTVNSVKLHEAAQARKLAEEKAAYAAMAKEIKGKEFTLPIRCGENGRLFGSVTAKEISDALVAAGYEIDKKQLVIKEPIKTVGPHPVSVKLYANVSSDIVINVVPEV